MLNLLNLRVQIQQRRNRLHRTEHEYFDDELLYMFQFFDENAYVRNLLTTIEASREVDFEQWKEGLDQFSTVGVQFPRTELGKAKVCLGILKHCVAEDNNDGALSWAYYFSPASNYNEKLADFASAVIDPFLNYLEDQTRRG